MGKIMKEGVQYGVGGNDVSTGIPTVPSGTSQFLGWYKSGNIVAVSGVVATTSEIANNNIILANIPAQKTNSATVSLYDSTASTVLHAKLGNDGTLRSVGTIATGHSLRLNFAYTDYEFQ